MEILVTTYSVRIPSLVVIVRTFDPPRGFGLDYKLTDFLFPNTKVFKVSLCR